MDSASIEICLHFTDFHEPFIQGDVVIKDTTTINLFSPLSFLYIYKRKGILSQGLFLYIFFHYIFLQRWRYKVVEVVQ